MRQYADLVKEVLAHGQLSEDRTGVGTLRLFGNMLRFNDTGRWFPATTLKYLALGQVAKELLCFLRAYQWLSEFNGVGCNIWDANARAWTAGQQRGQPEGEAWLGRVYGVQWRRWNSVVSDSAGIASARQVDQLAWVAQSLREDPTSRRHVVTAWNPGELDQMCLPPCHVLFQFYCRAPLFLDCCVYMRSVDLMLGLPFDVASYALLTAIMAREVGRQPGNLSMMMGDTHVYVNHLKGAAEMLERRTHPLPQLELDPACRGLDSFRPEHVKLLNYNANPPIKFELNV